MLVEQSTYSAEVDRVAASSVDNLRYVDFFQVREGETVEISQQASVKLEALGAS